MGPLKRYQSGGITVIEGDFFELTPELAGTFPAIYDRAALIALPPQERPDYATRLLSLLEPEGVILLITLHGPIDECKCFFFLPRRFTSPREAGL